MKKILYLIIFFLPVSLSLVFTSCASTPEPERWENMIGDSKELASLPMKSDSINPTLEVIGVYKTSGGNLYVYRFGKDTIYWAEGLNSSFPVSLQVK